MPADASTPAPDARGPVDAAAPDSVPPIAYDCDNLPGPPFALVEVEGPVASEDLAFDGEGNLIGANDYTIFKSPRGGPPSVFTNLTFRAGLRFLPNGDLVVADDERGELVRIDGTGSQRTIVSGLRYPNGLAVDLQGMVYVTEHDGASVLRVDPDTGAKSIIVDGDIDSPNGIAFNLDYSVLYIGSFSGEGTVYQVPIGADGKAGALTAFATEVGSGALDGLAVDACGNVYVCDYAWGESSVIRISADGATKQEIIPAAPNRYLPNMQWGSGVGGWDSSKLYLPDGWDHDVYEVDLGVPGKPRVYP